MVVSILGLLFYIYIFSLQSVVFVFLGHAPS